MRLMITILVAFVASSSAIPVPNCGDTACSLDQDVYSHSRLNTRDIKQAMEDVIEVPEYLIEVLYHLVKDGYYSEE
jgi:hypothetical protein